jgi:hypothetical protein
MSLFTEIEIFQLFCLFWSNMLRAITAYDISSLWRDIRAPSVLCLNLIFKIKFYFRNLQPQFPETCLFIQVSVAAKYRLKSVSQKDMSMLLRCTSLHSFKLCYIAEPLREGRMLCFRNSIISRKDPACTAQCRRLRKGFILGYCFNGVCSCM